MAPQDAATPPVPAPAARALSGVEALKQSSRRLRGDLAAELAGPGAQVSEDGYNLLKFHGSYEQYDRDTATERKQRGEEKEYNFMLRVRMPGGILTAAQYLALDELADRYGNASLRITTRQGVQFHGVIKGNLKATAAAINAALLTTQAACGDVVRNVMSTPRPLRDARHARLVADAKLLSARLLPASRAYHQIFLDEPDTAASGEEFEPLYGSTYLPRKFKIAIATPDDNTVDVFANDLGFIALFEGDTLLGYNLTAGGGFGMTHNRKDTYPRAASILGFVAADQLLPAAEAVISLQRDNGDRSDRKRARLKYVLDDRGLDWVKAELIGTYHLNLQDARPMPPIAVPDLLGWHDQGDGQLWLGVPLPSGRIVDTATVRLRTALRENVQRVGPVPVMTPQQDVLLTNIAPAHRGAIEQILRGHGVALSEDLTPLARWALACPALPTCGLALTEAERVRAPLVEIFEGLLRRHGLIEERISLRITGCPNGCARTYAGDIGIVGRVPGAYAIYVGGDFAGTRLSFKLYERVKEERLVATLEPIVARFARDRAPGEGFGDFCHRHGAAALLAMVG